MNLPTKSGIWQVQYPDGETHEYRVRMLWNDAHGKVPHCNDDLLDWAWFPCHALTTPEDRWTFVKDWSESCR